MIEGYDSGIRDHYRYLYIVDALGCWEHYAAEYDARHDLVLTYDLALHKEIESLGGDVFYLDHLVEADTMHANNFLVYRFFTEWHYDVEGKDIFTYKGIPFGLALRMEYWNDYTTFLRLYLSLSVLREVQTEALHISTEDSQIVTVLNLLEVVYERRGCSMTGNPGYYFPIAQWMDERVRPSGLRGFLYKTRELVTRYYGLFMQYADKIFLRKNVRKIFIQEYHPTKALLARLRADKHLKVVLVNFSRGLGIREMFSERLLPIFREKRVHRDAAVKLFQEFEQRKVHRLILKDGTDISDAAYALIEVRIAKALPNALRILDSAVQYLEKDPVDLEILIANIGLTATLFDRVCQTKGIPSYLIINGLLGPAYGDDSKYATVINAYSESIKQHYFRGMENIVTLGDPRMDRYSQIEPREINRTTPVVTIGASGFNPVDLNSYVSVEFDFMFDVLSAFQILADEGHTVKIHIKVRPNGYRKQYETFAKTFFPKLELRILDRTPMQDVLMKTDFYISIYSQTLFEASSLGIPVVYYKKDNEIMDPPFDGDSELVTVTSIAAMIEAYQAFVSGDTRYEPFLDRKIMEKYIGPLDGKNLQRNVDFVYDLLAQSSKENMDV